VSAACHQSARVQRVDGGVELFVSGGGAQPEPRRRPARGDPGRPPLGDLDRKARLCRNYRLGIASRVVSVECLPVEMPAAWRLRRPPTTISWRGG